MKKRNNLIYIIIFIIICIVFIIIFTCFATSKSNYTDIDIEKDVRTISAKMRNDISDFFKNKKKETIAEIGSYKGYTTRFLSKLFNKVYAVDHNQDFHNESKKINNDTNNIIYKNIDLYNKIPWNIKDDSLTAVFIDANHEYETCKSDILNSIKTFPNLEYIILDDYGVWEGVKRVVDEYLKSNLFTLEKFIGLTDVPGPGNKIYKNVKEGIIVKVNRNNLHY